MQFGAYAANHWLIFIVHDNTDKLLSKVKGQGHPTICNSVHCHIVHCETLLWIYIYKERERLEDSFVMRMMVGYGRGEGGGWYIQVVVGYSAQSIVHKVAHSGKRIFGLWFWLTMDYSLAWESLHTILQQHTYSWVPLHAECGLRPVPSTPQRAVGCWGLMNRYLQSVVVCMHVYASVGHKTVVVI